MVGSFDAGYGTWYLEETIGRRRAKEMWYLNRKYSAEQALDMGLINEIAADPLARATEIAQTLRQRGPFALASLKTAFSGRHTGVAGQARLAHDLLLTAYRSSQEAEELSASFEQRREPDRSKFNR
jgi:naphthoate synthase